MLTFPNFDPKSLSDNELFEKQLVLTQRQYMALRFGKIDAANQLQQLLQAIEIERTERMFVDRIGNAMLNSGPVVLETDPSLQVETEQPAAPKATTPAQPRRHHIRTARPVTPKME
jgi:hypothetical protein